MVMILCVGGIRADYSPSPGSVYIRKGSTSYSFRVSTRSDSRLEYDEIFTVVAYPPKLCVGDRNRTALVTIENDDGELLSFVKYLNCP